MSNAARKARKDRGGKLERTAKAGTPLMARRSFIEASPRRKERMAIDRGIPITVTPTPRTIKVVSAGVKKVAA